MRTIFSIVLACLTFAACATDGLDGQDGSSCTLTPNDDGSATLTCLGPDGTETSVTVGGPDCSVPPSTIIMHYEWNEADTYRRDCSIAVDLAWHECTQNGFPDCNENRDEREEQCSYTYAGWLNKIPLRECGTTIFDITGNPWDGGYSRSANQTDFDGDGIGNWHEYLMGLNPCTPHAYGMCHNDADLDFDADGKPNGTDDNPYCNPDNDPAGWFTDCV